MRMEEGRNIGIKCYGRSCTYNSEYPPKVSVSELMGILKGKTAIKLFKSYPGLKSKPYWGNHFWSRGYCVSTVGLNEDMIRRYVKYQEETERLEEHDEQEFGLF